MVDDSLGVSILQGGPSFPVLISAGYHYISTKEYAEMTVVPDPVGLLRYGASA